jgi:DNA-binding NtrC family response regulator
MSDTPHETLLVVDDSEDTLELLRRSLTAAGYRVFCAHSVPEAISALESQPMDLVVTDWKMPRVSGLDLVRHVRENLKDTAVMMITGYASIEGAVEAVRTGAEDYLGKPFTDDELLAAVRRALSRRRLSPDPNQLDTPPLQGMIGRSEAMQKVFRQVRKAADIPATVLISGESGTGKELIARAIHYSSKRGAAPFVPVNCGGIPESLLESELFGHVKGAFTGASETRAGFFQTADGGSIFLDEIGETSLNMQVKLLRVLQEKKIYMVGSTRAQTVNVRIIAATNKDLNALVRHQRFREDLYFRLNVINIEAPPLRDRGEDILLLLDHYAAKTAAELGVPSPAFTENARRAIAAYHWPGNVRELENLVQRLVAMSDESVIDTPDLPPVMRYSAPRGHGLDRSLAEVELDHIRNVLVSVDGNKTRAAEILGIDRKTLREKLKKSPLEDGDDE